MPSPSKKPRAASALARFINSLRPDRRPGATGSLPLQTGFPTSLADLYVKNQSRLKKPSKKSKKKQHVADSECLLTPVDSATDPSIVPPDSICGGNVDEVVAEVERIASAPNDKVIVCPRRNSVGIGFVLIVNIVVLVLLAIFGSKLILGFTALAFFSWFLDSVRLDLIQFFKPHAEMRPNLCLEQRNFAVVSPIREVEIQTESESTEAEIGAELDHEPREIEEIWEEISDVCEVQQKNSKKKSILKRLLSKKRLKKKQQVRDDEGLEGSSVRSSKAKERELAAAVNSEKEEVEEDEIVDLATEETQEEQQQHLMARETIPSAETIGEEEDEEEEMNGRISWWVVFPMVALFGLMEGKAIALLLTIFCFLSVTLIELARRNQCKHNRIRFTL